MGSPSTLTPGFPFAGPPFKLLTWFAPRRRALRHPSECSCSRTVVPTVPLAGELDHEPRTDACAILSIGAWVA
ncbi:MAG: hypothetical protein M0029_02805 [Actinomycetota bacterium]|nr:hypothetical protein [Actinomycetota bacterium]